MDRVQILYQKIEINCGVLHKKVYKMYKFYSLFADVGGIDLGFLQTKECEIVYANEFDKYVFDTYEKILIQKSIVEIFMMLN